MATARRQLGYVSSLTTQGIPLMTYGVATGGSSASRTVGGQNYTVLTFTSDSNLTVTTAGLFDVLLVGGGGGAGTSAGHGGGGAGALVGFASTTTIYLAAGTYAIDIGAGGSIGVWNTNGSASYIGSIISACGGGGGGSNDAQTAAEYGRRGMSGGSGGGSILTQNPAGVTVDDTFGNNGGIGNGVHSTAGGGGGGYGSAGSNQAGSTTGGKGGDGVDVSSWGTVASGTDYIAAGGGGGGTGAGGAAGLGGVAGTTGNGNNATTAGSGGGGGATTGSGGNGAAGKVWVRFKV